MNPTVNEKINDEITRMKNAGIESFCPADLAKRFNTTSKKITQCIRDRQDVYLKRKAHARRFNPTTISPSIEPEYYPSVWGIRRGAEA